MEHSGYVAAAHAAIAYVKASVKYRGLNTGGGWIRNPADIVQKFIARIDSKMKGSERSDRYKGQFQPELYINEMEKLGKESGTGNCSELSAVAFNYLRTKGVRPIEYFGVYRGGWNHAFVILNRDAGIPIADFAKWSYLAVLCDPLYDRAADAGHLATWYPRIIPCQAKDLVFRLE